MIRAIISISLVPLLVGCGGGGAGGGVTPTPFTSYSGIVYPSTVKMCGSSQEATYTYSAATGISVATPSNFTSGASITNTWDASHVLTNETVTSFIGTTILSLNAANGDMLGQAISGTTVVYGKSANGQNYLLEADHANAALAWNYQNFGVWLTGATTSFGSVGAMTVGAETTAASIPPSGSYMFTGVSGGYYVDGSGNGSFVVSNMSASVNFGTRSIAFSTTGSVTTNNLSATPVANNNLNMTGTLTYSGLNQYAGAVTTTGGGPANAVMSGTATGKFYGPSAQEMGGTFSVSNGTAAYIGGFGGKR